MKGMHAIAHLRHLQSVTLDLATYSWDHDTELIQDMDIVLRWAVIHQLISLLHHNMNKYDDFHLATLKIHGLPTDNDRRWTGTRAFTDVLKRVEHLRLTIEDDLVAPDVPKSFHPHIPTRDFWSELWQLWLKPCSTTLITLQLGHRTSWGWFQPTTFENFSFPKLQVLKLGQFTISRMEHVEWICRLGATLEELHLDDCAVLLQAQSFHGFDLVEHRFVDEVKEAYDFDHHVTRCVYSGL